MQDIALKMEEDYSFDKDGKFLKLLIRVRLDMEEDFSSGRIKKSELWNRVWEKVKEEIPGLKYSKEQISRKYLNLLTTYKRIKNRSIKSGKITTTWEYFDEFDDAFGDRYPINTSTHPSPNLDMSENYFNNFVHISDEMLHNIDSASDHKEHLKPLTDDPLKELYSLSANEEYETEYKHKSKLFENSDDYTCTNNEDNFESWAKKKKDLLEIELLEMRNYKIKLEIWEKEQELQLAPSKYTRDIIKN
ncbi:hypothetical protein DOY81_000967 [Sarcophaga bullata]|nr:hypothetical protein DOY81_000967 [Sarcophaga bullata]